MRIRRAGRGDRVIAGLWAGTSLAVLSVPFLLNGRTIDAECAFKLIFGLACPTCGLTRAYRLMIGGDWAGALSMNPFFVASGVLFVAAGLAAPFWVMFRAPVPGRLTHLPAPIRIGGLLLFLVNWTYLVCAGV